MKICRCIQTNQFSQVDVRYLGGRLLGALLQLGSGAGRPGRQVVQLSLKALQLPQQNLNLQLALRQSPGHLNRDRLCYTQECNITSQDIPPASLQILKDRHRSLDVCGVTLEPSAALF